MLGIFSFKILTFLHIKLPKSVVSYGLSFDSPIWKYAILSKGTFQSRRSPSLQLCFKKCWQLGSQLRPCCHITYRGQGSGPYHQLCSQHNTSKDNILVGFLKVIFPWMLSLPCLTTWNNTFRWLCVQPASPTIPACLLLVDIDTVSEVVHAPCFVVKS